MTRAKMGTGFRSILGRLMYYGGRWSGNSKWAIVPRPERLPGSSFASSAFVRRPKYHWIYRARDAQGGRSPRVQGSPDTHREWERRIARFRGAGPTTIVEAKSL